MKRVLFVLIFMCLASITQAAIVAFEAEDDTVYYQAGANWTTVEDAAALGGLCITGTVNLPANEDVNRRFYSFQMPAGTYHLFVRLNITVANGNDDSFYLSNDSLAEDAPMTDYNGIDTTDIDGNTTAGAGNFGWVRARQSYGTTIRTYVMATDGTAYFKMGPREDGLYIDALAFVPAADTDTVTGAELDEAVFNSRFRPGAAINPIPDGSGLVDSQATTAVQWSPPLTQFDVDGDPNLVSVEQFDITYYILDKDQVGADDPNWLTNGTFDDDVTSPYAVSLTYDQTMFWRVDTHVVWDSNEITGTASTSQVVEGFDWMFTTLPQDKTPIVTADDVLTSMDFLPASLVGSVDDWDEEDIASIVWEVVVPAAGKRVINRTGASDLANLAQFTSDPNLLQDWIGSDTRQTACNPLTLTLKGLPVGTYTWSSYHHDAQNQQGTFDVTVADASGTATTTDIQITDANSTPVTLFTTAIESNGSDDVTLSFKMHPYGDNVNIAFFVMNGFELTDGVSVDPLFVDFGSVDGPVLPGYQAYEATNANAASFTEQSYSAFGTTVSIQPTWGGVATATDTINDPTLATQQATFTTDRPGTFSVRLTATDDTVFGPDALTGSATLTVTVAADACAAAQLSDAWDGFSEADFNEDCVVNLDDFAELASDWLGDRQLTVQE